MTNTPWTTTLFISDTHGFREAWTTLLRELGVIDEDDNWCAPEGTRLVHLGDHTDRGEDSIGMYRLMKNLREQAPEGAVILLLGNHDLQYVGGPWCGTEKLIMDELADEMKEDLKNGITQFAWRFETEGGDEWLCIHAGLDAKWEELHEKPMDEVVDFINEKGRALVTEGRRSSIICGVGRSRGGGFGEMPGIAWCDFWMDLRTGEYLLNHKQIVGHTIQPRGIERSRIGKLWGVNVHYDHAQALVYDHATDTFTPSVHMAPEDSAYYKDVKPGTPQNRKIQDAINRYDAGILEKAVTPPEPPPDIDWDNPIYSAFL